MNNEPNWLDIEQELYPNLYIMKTMCVQVPYQTAPLQYAINVAYNSLHRQINITENIFNLMTNYFQAASKYRIFIFDGQDQQFKQVSSYPIKQPIILKGPFIQQDRLIIRIQQQFETVPFELKKKNKTQKTVKYILQKVAQWRKLHVESSKKVTLEEAAEIVGISRNTLDDYYFQIKSAQKYGFSFQQNFEQPFQNLRKFVKQNEEKKEKNSNPIPNILAKFHPK